MANNGVVFCLSFHEAIRDLPDEERLNAYDAIIRYGLYGETIEMMSTIKSMFILVKPVIDKSQSRYRAAKANGSKGGRPQKNQTGNQSRNHIQYQDIDTDTDTDFEEENEVYMETQHEGERKSSRGEGGEKVPYRPLSADEFEKRR